MEGRRQGAAVSAAYNERLAARRATVAHGEALHARISWTRLGLLGMAVVLIIALGSASAPWLAIPGGLFVPLAFYHGRVLNRRDRAARAMRQRARPAPKNASFAAEFRADGEGRKPV